jgi:hypothetical protein
VLVPWAASPGICLQRAAAAYRHKHPYQHNPHDNSARADEDYDSIGDH